MRTAAPRRDHRCEPVTLFVEYEEAGDLVADYADNLSAGRIFVPTRREVDIGSPVQLVLSFPGLLHPIRLTSTVRSVYRGTSSGDPDGLAEGSGPVSERGLGLEIDDRSGRAALQTLVERLRVGDPGVVGTLLKVLLVEDNPQVCQLIRDGLRGSEKRRCFGPDLAFDIRTASNGRDAIDRLHRDHFDMLILDIYLPVLDGTQVLHHVRADDALHDLPVIAVSAGGDSARDEALEAGADFFLHKPMRLRQVVETMRLLMNPEPRGSIHG